MTILETVGVSVDYTPGTPMQVHALRGLDLKIEQGEILGVIGRTGSGKSTLVQVLGAQLRPTSGKVLLDGRDIWDKPKKLRQVRFDVGIVFQYPEYQLFEETVAKDIAFGPKNKGISGKELEAVVAEAAEFVGLDSALLERSPFELSGGEKRRAAIAGVIAMKPRVLVLDEPAAGLDPKGREDILERVRGYRDRTGAAVVLVSHSMEDVASVCERVLVLESGEGKMCAPVSEVFSCGEQLEALGLRVPQITQVFLELKKRGLTDDASVYTVEDGLAAALSLLKGGEA